MLFIGIPTYNGLIHHTTVAGLIQTAHLCAKAEIGLAVEIIPHDAFIGKARSLIAKRFLESGASDLLFVDADIGFTSKDVIAVCKPDADIVMGLYRMKVPGNPRFPAMLTDPIERNEKDPSLIKLHYGPTGFMRIRRNVIEKMIEAFPDEWFSDDQNGKIYDLFPHGREGNSFYGEDINFCRRAQQCGFDIHAVQGIFLKHMGEASWESTWQLDIPKDKDADLALSQELPDGQTV